MGKFVVRTLLNALALWIAAWILPGINVAITASTGFEADHPTASKVVAFIFIGLVFGLVNAVVKPIVKLVSLPVTILTLGLFTVVINAAMLWLTAWLSEFTPVHFTIDTFFFTAVWAAIIISIISMLTSGLTRKSEQRSYQHQ